MCVAWSRFVTNKNRIFITIHFITVILLQWCKGKAFRTVFFEMWTVFSLISFNSCLVWLWFFFERKDMILDNLPDILNMVIRRVENFLRTFEKNSLEKIAFWSISLYFTNPILKVNFSKSKLLLRFLTHNLFGVSYDSDFFSSVKIWSSTTFQIYWTWSYDAQKIF